MNPVHKQIAITIREQLRFGDALRPARWAAREWAVINEGDHGDIGKAQAGLAFKVSGTVNVKVGGYVAVYLMWDDTYTVRVITKRGATIKPIALKTDVYCDELGEVIDEILDGKR